jgi:predicted phage terminase large subunit-like protein
MKQANPARYRWKMLGHWLEGEEGLLWTEAMIAGCGVDVVPPLTTRIVAVDPAVTATAQSDETGIILLGKGTDGRVYVLGDYSGRYSPAQWGGIVKDICLSESVDMVVAEKNQGGDLVSANLRNCGVTRPVQLVTATKGKLIRAEPVYALYEQGKIKHAKGLGRLESQMITFNPAQNENSPDRVDALVWGVTKLALTKSIFAV